MLEASRLLHELLPDSEGALGRDHPMTRLTFLNRSLIAARTAYAGDLREALRLFAELLADQERELGRDDEVTLKTRSAIGLRNSPAGSGARARSRSRSCAHGP